MKRLIALAAAAALLVASPLSAQTQYQFPNSPWQPYAPGEILCGWLYGANANITTDQAIPISVPTGTWMVSNIIASNPSVSLTTASGGVYSAVSKGGVAIAANQALSTLTTNAANTAGNAMLLTISTAGQTTAFQGLVGSSLIKTIYLSLTTAQGAASTFDLRIRCRPLF